MSKNSPISRRRFARSAGALSAFPLLLRAAYSEQNEESDQMTILTPYLLFDGHCKQAMEFYKACFGGSLTATKVKDSPVKGSLPEFQQEKVLFARLKSSHVDISSSDWLRPHETPIRGNTVCMYLSQGTVRELTGFFGKLSEGGDITDPLKEMPYGTYGALNDKFGVRWMFHTDSKA